MIPFESWRPLYYQPRLFCKTFGDVSENLASIESLNITRCIQRKDFTPISYQLHSFSDASETGFGAAVSLRSKYTNGKVSCHLIVTKSKVAPVRQIPRLELEGALVASRLVKFVLCEINLPIEEVIFWVDSQTVLQWIHSSTHRFHAFVGHRVSEIRESLSSSQWRHLACKLNPADDCSRGIPATELTESNWLLNLNFSPNLKITGQLLALFPNQRLPIQKFQCQNGPARYQLITASSMP